MPTMHGKLEMRVTGLVRPHSKTHLSTSRICMEAGSKKKCVATLYTSLVSSKLHLIKDPRLNPILSIQEISFLARKLYVVISPHVQGPNLLEYLLMSTAKDRSFWNIMKLLF